MLGPRRALIGAAILALSALVPATRHTAVASSTVGPKAYYLALGDSLAFGFQISLQFFRGYADDFYADLKTKGTTNYVNMGCGGETSVTFVNGGCPFAIIRKVQYHGPQLAAALAFIRQHPGQVSPVTFDIGANDVLPLINTGNCTVSSNITSTLATVDANIVSSLTQLKAALNGTGDLFMMNYYDPYQNICPNLVPDAQILNSHIAADAARFNVPVADVFSAFGGAATPNPNICAYTWMCSQFQDIHATTLGYAVIAHTFEQLAGY